METTIQACHRAVTNNCQRTELDGLGSPSSPPVFHPFARGTKPHIVRSVVFVARGRLGRLHAGARACIARGRLPCREYLLPEFFVVLWMKDQSGHGGGRGGREWNRMAAPLARIMTNERRSTNDERMPKPEFSPSSFFRHSSFCHGPS